MTPAIEKIQNVIDGKQRCVLTTHVNPDGDGLGSELALARFLEKLGKSVTIINHSATPDNYRWMDQANGIIKFLPERDRDYILDADVIFIVDTNQPDRLRSLEPFIRQSKGIKIVIDHHLEPHSFGDHYLIDDDATSTGEIVYRIITSINPKLLDKEIAQALYTAIMTDTGSFRYPRTDPEIHRIVSHLLEYGISPIEVYSNVYEGWSPGRMRLLGEVLDSMKTAYDGRLAYVVCTQEMFKKTGTTEIETDNFTSFPMSVRGVQVGILFNELNNGVKISFRSKGMIPINELAKEFGGNGHLNAAGTRIFDARLDEIVASVVDKANKYLT
ncbi:MAG TPA: bifunctional oligoribonuclease/PAP phosphatase NrnA [Bacteroidota bacterium]|jgi:phosphoesterase RecJ-like protein|nr:bifunctional oligoribonuclease/PAP phosphatase NrnA [Bacteroidota bacterium]